MYKEIIKLKKTEKIVLEKRKSEYTDTINKIANIKKVYESELKTSNSKDTMENYIKDTMNVKLILSEMSQMSEQIKNNNMRIEYLKSLIIEKNIEIEKYKYLQDEIDLEILEEQNRKINLELQELVMLKEIKRLKNL